MRRLILHCGPPKTGTSAIQAHLRAASPTGMIYPTTGQWPDGAHHKLVFALEGRTRRGEIEIRPWEQLAPDLIREIDAAERGIVLISSERLDIAMLGNFLDRLLPQLARPFDDISTVLVLRHPLERAASAYNQDVKDAVTAEHRLPDIYLAKTGNRFRLLPLVRSWQDSPYETRFLSYHPAGTLLHRFLQITGCSDRPAPTGKKQKRNASISGYGLLALLAAHRMGFSPEDRARLLAGLRVDKNNRIWTGPSFPFSADAARKFMQTHVKDDLIAVRDLTGIDLTPLHHTPPERFSLTKAQRQAARRQFGKFDLKADQQKRLTHMLGIFAGSDR